MIGNQGSDIWVEKMVEKNKSLIFKGRKPCEVNPTKLNHNDKRAKGNQIFGRLTSARIPGILIPECQNKIPLDFHKDRNGSPLFNYKPKTCSFIE